jgi:hypothetical protein
MTTAQLIYVGVLLWCCCCLGYGHHTHAINLWTLITTTKNEKEFADAKKLAYIGAFVVSTVTLAYWGVVGKELSPEYIAYATLYFGTWLGGKYLGDREQRLQRQISDPPEKPGP